MPKSKVVNKGPLKRLSGRVAQPKVLAAMSWRERGARTCGVCDITYLAPVDSVQCEEWHFGRTS